jgi:hypothetical protein
MAVDPHAEAPTVAQTNPGDEPTVPQAAPVPITPTVTTPTLAVGGPPTVASPTAPMAAPKPPAAPAQPPPAQPPPAQPAPAPAKVAGRVIVPGATPPGQKKKAAPTTPTHLMARQDTAVEPRQSAAPRTPVQAPYRPAPARPPRRRKSGFRRFVTAIIALVLVVAVPVVSAYVSYKLASGENPFEWPPTVDYDSFFPR